MKAGSVCVYVYGQSGKCTVDRGGVSFAQLMGKIYRCCWKFTDLINSFWRLKLCRGSFERKNFEGKFFLWKILRRNVFKEKFEEKVF